MSAETKLVPATLSPLLHDDFLIGIGTAAYQIEGAAGEDGRSNSIWDVFCRQPGSIRNGENGDVACDHYHRWKDDVSLLRQLGVDAYRFSISWSRVLPDDSGRPNAKGIEFYQNLVNELRAAGIRPLVTLYHWDLPQYLQDKGGWQSRETAQRFADYTELVAQSFGQSVDFYSTINEPWCITFLGHREGIHAPGIQDESAAFGVAHHLMLAHGLSVQKLRQCAPHAEIGIVLNGGKCHPASSSADDANAAQLAENEQIYLFADPLLKGEYPQRLVEMVSAWVEPGDMEVIAEPCDYLGWNFYSRNVVGSDGSGGFEYVTLGEYALTDMGWEIYPQGLQELIWLLNERYQLPPMYITENGAAFDDELSDGSVYDAERVQYLDEHLGIIVDLLQEGFDIRGYVCWSLMDNFEWAEGYSKRFGLIHVDYDSQERTIKESGKALAKLMASKRQRN